MAFQPQNLFAFFFCVFVTLFVTHHADLDDQTSGWIITNNTFVNMSMGILLGGGKQNKISDNYFQDCDTAVHFDNRAMGWEEQGFNCTAHTRGPGPCLPGGCIRPGDTDSQQGGWPPVVGRDCAPRMPPDIHNSSMVCFCNPAAVHTMLSGPGASEWQKQFGEELAEIFTPECTSATRGGIPCHNRVTNNTYCRTGKFLDATEQETSSWSSLVADNVEQLVCRV